MRALIPGSECMRVYSILGTRPYRNSGAGAGAGISDSRFDPRHIPGCVLMCCTNTAAYPGAVVFPADPLVNGNFEGAAGPPPAGWSQFQCLGTREAGTRTGGSGSYAGQVAFDGVNASGLLYEAALVVGNTYTAEGWAKSVDGAAIPKLDSSVSGLAWAGAASTDWQHIPPTTFVAGGTQLRARCDNLAAGRAVQFDDITIAPRNSSQLTDLTGLGHHPVQATAAAQPLLVASGAGGYLSFDGTADNIQAAFTCPRPNHRFVLASWTRSATTYSYMLDGVTGDSASVFRSSGSNNATQQSGANTGAVTVVPNGAWMIFDDVMRADANMKSALNLGAFTVSSKVAASDPGGMTIGSYGNGVNYPAQLLLGAVLDFSRELSEGERQRVGRWLNRQKAFLAL